jgi:hypothetical protein
MENYTSITEFMQKYGTREACYQHLYDLKWSQGYQCLKCEHPHWVKGRKWHYRKCQRCHYDESSTANTLFHKLKFPIEKAFMITYQLSTMKKGMSSCEISRQYGIHQETAWYFRRKVQRAMQSLVIQSLRDNVEVDEAMIGGVETGRKGRSKGKKRKIQIAAEVGYPEDDKPAYLKRAGAYMIDDFSATSLGKGLRNMVHKDAVITTDGWSGYQPVAKDFWHEVFLSNKGDNFKLLHWHIFNLKNWIRGVHHKISRAHLQSYLDEYHFRFNSRNHLKSNPNLVLSLMVNHDWFPYKQAKGT